ncbi:MULTISPECIES: ABC transporter ATP-binding protein [unclassified Nonomuraea]|uniref:ABC transporter ATP-binding protein n=1 Tax=unclassified Nonomuraea TaxID=2593643 RepID=UPI0033C355F8
MSVRRALGVTGRLIGFDVRLYVLQILLWLPVHALPLGGGLVLRQLFDQISGHSPATLRQSLWLCAAFAGVELVRGIVLVFAWSYGSYWWDAAATLLRANVLGSVLTARGPVAARLPRSPGESLARLRDDVAELVELADESVPLAGGVLFGGAALAVMISIDPVVTVTLVVPMLAIGVLSRLMGRVIRRRHQRARELGAGVTAFVGELFGGVLALRTAGAERAALERLRTLNARRRDAAVRSRLATDLLEAATGTTVELGVGVVLLLAAGAMRRGEFTVGDLALFTSYVGWLTALPRTIASVLYRLPRADVSAERLTALLAPHQDTADLTHDHPLHLNPPRPPSAQSPGHPLPLRPTPPPGGPPPNRTLRLRPTLPAPPAELPPSGEGPAAPTTLEVLEVRGMSVRHPGGRGVHDVDLTLRRGTFTVVTGAVGAGKTTLVRALLGLLPLDAGTITWNGRPVPDPGAFLVPGRAAYASQIPRLFSETLRENLLLGLPAGDADLARALELAAFEDDLAAMPDGLETVVGPRGVRLSGGQVQRATAARALVRAPDLLVVDDVSSALDVGTENLLWERIARHGPATLLVVSSRRAALERADQVVVLDRGRVAGRGPLGELLRTCPEMRRLWNGEPIEERGST